MTQYKITYAPDLAKGIDIEYSPEEYRKYADKKAYEMMGVPFDEAIKLTMQLKKKMKKTMLYFLRVLSMVSLGGAC